MKVTNQKEADALVNDLCLWLSTKTKLELLPHAHWEPSIANHARKWCNQLLNASKANGMKGCLLCQG